MQGAYSTQTGQKTGLPQEHQNAKKKPVTSDFIDRYNRRVLTDDGNPGIGGKEGTGSTEECMKSNVAGAIYANCRPLDHNQPDEIISWVELYRP